MEITGRGCCLTLIGVIGATIGIFQVTFLIEKLTGGTMSWVWVFSPIWLTLLIVFGVPILFALVDKLIKRINKRKDDKV